MRIVYSLTEQDYLEFNLYHFKHSPSMRRSLNLQRYGIPLFILAFSFLIDKFDEIPLWAWLITSIIIALLWVIYYPKYFKNQIIKSVTKMVREGKNSNLLGRHALELSEYGLTEITENSETKTGWSGIAKFVYNTDYLYIYINSIAAHIIPTSAFESAMHKDEFVYIIEKNIKNVDNR